MTVGYAKMRINGISFKVPLCSQRDDAIRELAFGAAFAGGAKTFVRAVDKVLGAGAFRRISKGRRLDIFDFIDLAVYICAKYEKAKIFKTKYLE